MTNPNRIFFDLCFENRNQIARAITLAGGNAELVMGDAWNDMLFTLATNNVAINAVYRGEKYEPKSNT